MLNYIEEYYRQIKSGEIVASKRITKQYEKLIDDMYNHPQYIYDHAKAERPIKFIETFCRHSKGELAGKPLILDLFQKAYISALFGFVDKDTGKRRYTESFFYVARKNGKTTMLSAIALYMMIADGESGAEVYSVASKRDQANILFDQAHEMIKQSPDLSRNIRKRKSDLYFSHNFSKMQSLGKNSNSLDGLNAHLVVIDELHSIQDRNLYEVMKQSQSARTQPLLIMITTAGTHRGTIFDDLYEYACNVVDGNFKDDNFLPIMYELDKKSEYKKPECWQKANPSLNISKRVDDLERKVARAENDANNLTGILTKDFNVRETSHNAWLTFEQINNTATFDIKDFADWYAIGGADLSITTDLSCATLLFVDPETEMRYVHQMYWLPEDNLRERVDNDKIPYDKWHEQGLLRLCRGNTINYSDITDWFVEMIEDYEITPLWIYYDNYSARYWVDEMEGHGFKMVRTPQGAKTLSLPMQNLGADLKKHKVNYNNHPILKWCLTNTGIETDRNGNIVPVKNQSPKRRIDGTASLLDAYVGLFDNYESFLRAM
ncbi:terminase large subunit [Staphylococcus simulans]|uniref:terminase large subunit n=2 Tax=Staphylococcus simulans TaxID=1286 RepID=UPI000D03BB2E|nr:terminase large subunit [Staphylococcus simulans]AVO02807.1 terminase [Staphylococcus simulans]AVO05753.1 terminase [Staphylococcus simulans]AWG19355.1 terminase [Staphylococcus simulans]AWI02304.1 terminase [Staphylococcus simulans]PTI97189.1 terminase large subunit [Staphylococcus simulans]